jgi:ABC-type phosphate/phosphonate transport system permease subunit
MEFMTPKKVWGVILIVLGVLSIIGGFQNFYVADFAEKEIISINDQFSKISPKFSLKNFDNTDYARKFKETRLNALFGILFGILLSIIGTCMLKERKVKMVYSEKKEVEQEVWDEPKFRL